jgi:hypothetical protein
VRRSSAAERAAEHGEEASAATTVDENTSGRLRTAELDEDASVADEAWRDARDDPFAGKRRGGRRRARSGQAAVDEL